MKKKTGKQGKSSHSILIISVRYALMIYLICVEIAANKYSIYASNLMKQNKNY